MMTPHPYLVSSISHRITYYRMVIYGTGTIGRNRNIREVDEMNQTRLSEDGKVEWSFRGAGQEKVDTKMSYDEDGRLFMTVSVDIGSVPGMHDSKPPRNSEVFRDIMKSYGLQVESKPDTLFDFEGEDDTYVIKSELDPDILMEDAEEEAQNLYMLARENAADA